MERMMTVLVVLILFLLAFVTVLSSDLDRPPILAYELRDANDSEVNGRYLCQNPRLCWQQKKDAFDQRRLKLVRSTIFVEKHVKESRWYVEEMIPGKVGGLQLYGAIELSQEPFQHKSWKRLLPTKAEELSMEMSPLSLICIPDRNIVDNIQHVVSMYELLDNAHTTVPEFIVEAKKQLQNCFSVLLKEQSNEINSNLTQIMVKPIFQLIRCETYALEGSILPARDCFRAINVSDILPVLQGQQLGPLKSFAEKSLIHGLMFDLLYFQNPQQTLKYICESLSSDDFQRMWTQRTMHALSTFGSVSLFLLGRYDAWKISRNNVNTDSAYPKTMYVEYGTVCGLNNLRSHQFTIDVNIKSIHDMIAQLQLYSTVYISEYSGLESGIGNSGNAATDSNSRSREDVLNKIQFFFERFPSPFLEQSDEVDRDAIATTEILQSRQYFNYANSLVTTLLSAGKVDIASYHLLNVMLIEVFQVAESLQAPLSIIEGFKDIEKCASPQSWNYIDSICLLNARDVIADVVNRRMQCGSGSASLCQFLFNEDVKHFTHYLLTQSSLVRSVYLLHQLISNHYILQVLVSDNDLFSMFLSIVTQTANPVILETTNDYWLQEASLLRFLFLDILDHLEHACVQGHKDGSHHSSCYLRMDGQSSGVRGLFLEAYQGLSLLSTYFQTSLNTKSSQQQESSKLSHYLVEFNQMLSDLSSAKKYFSIIRHIQKEHPQAMDLDMVVREDQGSTDYQQSDALGEGLMPHLAKQFYNSRSSLHTITNGKRDKGPLKVAFVSYSLTRHSVGRLLSKIIVELSSYPEKYNLDVYVITNVPHIYTHDNASDETNNQRRLNSRHHHQMPRNSYDDVTEYLQSHIPSSHWIYLAAFNFGKVFQSTMMDIIGLELDIVVYTDVLMQPSLQVWTHSLRLAPVQMAFWGHPYTGGDEDYIDYFITSKTFEEESTIENRVDQFAEQLILFDTLSFQLYQPEPMAALLPDFPSLLTVSHYYPSDRSLNILTTIQQDRVLFLHWLYTKGYHIYGRLYTKDEINHILDVSIQSLLSFHIYGILQSLMKIHPLFDTALVKLLIDDPHAVIVLLRNPKQSIWQLNFQERLIRAIKHYTATKNINTIDVEKNIMSRIIFLNPLAHKYYAKVLCHVDVVLDPFPFGGGVTMCDAIAGGCHGNLSIPFVTSGSLQTVHHIAAGFGQVLHDSWYAVNSVRYSAVSKWSQFDDAIDEYVKQAIATAKTSHDKILNSNHNAPVINAYHEIYDRVEDVAMEWMLVFNRSVNMLD